MKELREILTPEDIAILRKSSFICPMCKIRLPHFQHVVSKVYICKCGGELHHTSSAGRLICAKCRRQFTAKENKFRYKFKVICPEQFGVEVKE